ncbi:MAG TPA: TIGR03862 family flavoprotein [Rhodocyclaceae bacterium]|nr:TIGR03862 family flavoprotein [Rhodocyclaceae bacterium]
MQDIEIAIIGGGPAGLMAAEVLAAAGYRVDVFEAMPSLGRKFLMAGKGGMNITHSEETGAFLSRYGDRRPWLEPMLARFGAEALREWIHGLGIETFIGTSGRVFPREMKAAPLLRAWLHRLREAGVRFHVRHRWLGWDAEGALRFSTPDGESQVRSAATVLALGGGSWAKLGSDGAWVPLLRDQQVSVAPLKPSNCGFDVGWTPYFRERFAGQPVKSLAASCVDAKGVIHQRRGECLVSASGIEGGLIYALSAPLRNVIEASGHAVLHLDLLPDRTLEQVQAETCRSRGSRSLSSHLQSRLGITGVKAGLLRECLSKDEMNDPLRLAAALKALPLALVRPRPLDEAISTAGGVEQQALGDTLMLKNKAGVFCAGEMLDWEAPTGGYLLTACFATGRAAGEGVARWLKTQKSNPG